MPRPSSFLFVLLARSCSPGNLNELQASLAASENQGRRHEGRLLPSNALINKEPARPMTRVVVTFLPEVEITQDYLGVFSRRVLWNNNPIKRD